MNVYWKRLNTIVKARGGMYSFSLADMWLYMRYAEYPGSEDTHPVLHAEGEQNDFLHFEIAGHTYYWPAKASYRGLPWIHQEVFAPPSCNASCYEYGETVVRNGDVVIDAGAFAGFFTQQALTRRAKKIIAIEPVSILAEANRKTFAEQINDGQVEVHQVGLGSESQQGFIHEDMERPFASQLSSEGTAVQIVSVDDLIGDTRIDFIKMDIEGAEIDAVKGAQDTIKRCKPKIAIAVYHELENARRIKEMLKEFRPDYHIQQRGIWAEEDAVPRPIMILAW